MADADLRLIERRWREARTIAAAQALVSARLREGALPDEHRAVAREAASSGEREPAERLLLDAWIRGSAGDGRIALCALDGTPGRDVDAREDESGILHSRRDSPCALAWIPPRGDAGERYVAGWLATLSLADRIFLWSRDVLSEPAVTDAERHVVLTQSLECAGVQSHIDDLERRHAAVVETATRPVLYTSGGYLEGGPPTIERTTARLTHGLLRRALLLDVSDGEGPVPVYAVLRSILGRQETLEPSRPEIRIASAQIFGVWESVSGSSESAVEHAAREIKDSYALRGACAVLAALPDLLSEEMVAGALDQLLAQGERATVAYALANHLGRILDRTPARIAREILAKAEEPAWGGDVSQTLVTALLLRGEVFDDSLRRAVETTLNAIAARGAAPEAFVAFLEPALRLGASWPTWCVPDDVVPEPAPGPGPWLRALAPGLLRALASSGSDWARTRVAEMWRGAGPERFPSIADVWRRLAGDPDRGVRAVLRTGEIDW